MDDQSFEDYRMGHLIRTADVWRKLLEYGTSEESLVDFDFQFSAPSKAAAEELAKELSDHDPEIRKEGLISPKWSVVGQSGAITWTEKLLLQWVDFLIVCGRDTGCEFVGCGATVPNDC